MSMSTKYYEMKKFYTLIILIFAGTVVYSQQTPLSENYFMDRYSFAPSYAGNYNPKFLFMGYRSDWSGINGGPKTFRLSYNDAFAFMKNAGYGGKIIYDKAGVFNQLYILGSYSYFVKIRQDHRIIFALSMGAYKNRLNLLDYYNDPKYTIDPSLIGQDVKSRLRFMSDFSTVWTWQGLEAGFLISNMSFGNVTYKGFDLKYNPVRNYQIHASYLYSLNKDWDITPLIIVRGGPYINSQFEIATQVMYTKKFWASLVFRDPGIWGFGIGSDIGEWLKISYNFNLATNIELGAFNNHEISIGYNIFKSVHKSE
jgi:type IX secretion system PorP/SprF family membrane protein